MIKNELPIERSFRQLSFRTHFMNLNSLAKQVNLNTVVVWLVLVVVVWPPGPRFTL